MDYEVKMAYTNQRTVKIKASHAQIVVGGSKENPVYSILYFDTDKGQWYIGWCSSHLVYVQNWLQEEFEPGYKRISDFITALLTRAKAAEAENAQLRAEVERWKSAHHQAALNLQQENRECNKALSELEQMKSENTALRKMQPVRLDDTGAQALALAAEVSELKRALAMMWFAYVNCDKETPHDYETQALEEAERLLGPWSECMPNYLRCGQKEE